ncbi:MAG TPA: nuclear transport factor 2 family protein [Burkholderiaceae bacterium]|jgi:ketosteroid isomerase-like protein|nr:nuclear transport factor 2 family protein [Burkholderiaceae bacterium]
MYSMTSKSIRPLLFASPEECEQAFYEAMESADIEAISDAWLDDEDVVCVHPGGARLIGYSAVRASLVALLSSGPVQIRTVSRKCFESPTVAVTNVIEEVVVVQSGGRQLVHVIATNAFAKTPSGWKMVLHHAAPAPQGRAADVEAPHGPVH